MHIPLAICKQFCKEDAMKFLCLCHYEIGAFKRADAIEFEQLRLGER